MCYVPHFLNFKILFLRARRIKKKEGKERMKGFKNINYSDYILHIIHKYRVSKCVYSTMFHPLSFRVELSPNNWGQIQQIYQINLI